MDEENKFNFKDKEIEKLTSEIAKASKHQLGESFQDAIARGRSESSQPQQVVQETSTAAGAGFVGSTVEPAQNSAPEIKTETAETVPAGTTEPTAEELASVIKPLQTYERDIAEAIRSNNESVASINLAQQKRVQGKGTVGERTEKIARKSLTFLISLVLIISAVGISALVYYFVINRPGPIEPTTPSLIITDKKIELDVSSLKPPEIAEKIKNEIARSAEAGNMDAEGNITRIELFENNVAPSPENPLGTKQKISAVKFFEFFALSSPPTLGRALGNQWVFGFQNIDNKTAPFIFLSIESFDNAFEGMHRWEERMWENLTPIFMIPSPVVNTSIDSASTNAAGATTTVGVSTTTNSITPINSISTNSANEFTTTNKFEDKIIRSKDVRVLKNTSGKIILLYSFIDQKNLIIATDEKTFEELLNRFFSSQIVR